MRAALYAKGYLPTAGLFHERERLFTLPRLRGRRMTMKRSADLRSLSLPYGVEPILRGGKEVVVRKEMPYPVDGKRGGRWRGSCKRRCIPCSGCRIPSGRKSALKRASATLPSRQREAPYSSERRLVPVRKSFQQVPRGIGKLSRSFIYGLFAVRLPHRSPPLKAMPSVSFSPSCA